MRAIVQERYGDPAEVFEIREVDRPTPRDGEVLVRVHAVPVTGTDWHLFRGLPYAARPATGLRRPRNRFPGLELSGTVVTGGGGFAVGDEVFGWCAGTFAEYVAVPANQLARKPDNVTLDEAAAGPIAAFTAYQAVKHVAAGDRVLVSGASGGVGTYAVQFAKVVGAHVTALCGKEKADLVAGLGADVVLDYRAFDYTGRGFDVLLDVYGSPSVRQCRDVVRPRGKVVMVGGTGGKFFMGTDRWLRALVLAPFLGFTARPVVHRDSHDDLVAIRDLVAAGAVRPVLSGTYPFDQAPQAIRDVHEGRARGHAVVRVAR
ncbi:NAD(P)-dependent alcohol dehydrogenase [Actinosynnema sp. NPDC020468]|uniref:NAD(P)-dependent alcohol dehydrogenase n=1 Tax=Actinosynnema sp. NPDC020468 TaxID=3154488 RepID=UPI0033BFF23B